MNFLDIHRPARAAYDIRFVTTQEDRDAVARLRYEVYVEEMGRTQSAADHARRMVHEALDKEGVVIGAFDAEGNAVGTLRLNASTSRSIAYRELYAWEPREVRHPGQVFLASKLIVTPKLRGGLLSLEIFRVAARVACANGWRFCFLDANAHLIALYTRLGFVARARRTHPLFGEVTIMELDMADIEHARTVRSPLARDFAEHSRRVATAA
jgi:predicted GNAT family N-acyltransferase